MGDACTRKMLTCKTLHPIPRPTFATALTATTEHVKPQTSYLVNETTNPVAVAWDGVIVQPALDNTTQPASRFTYGTVHSLSQFFFDRLQSRTHTLRNTVAIDRKPAMCSSLAAPMGEAKKIKRGGSTFAALLARLFNRIATELDQTRLAFVQLQTKLGKASIEVPPNTQLPPLWFSKPITKSSA